MSNYFNFFIPRYAQKPDQEKSLQNGILLIRNDEDISRHVSRLLVKFNECDLESGYSLAASRASNNLKYIEDLDQNLSKEQKRLDAIFKKKLSNENSRKASKKTTSQRKKFEAAIIAEDLEAYDLFEKLRRLKLLKIIISSCHLFERACETDFHRRRANQFFLSQVSLISQSFNNGDMQHLRNFIVETLCSLKILKKSAQDGLPNLRCYLRFIHALEEALHEHEHNGEKKELSLRRSCIAMSKPIAFPNWTNKTPCECEKEKAPLEGRLLENSPAEHLNAIQRYARELKTAREKCKSKNEEEDCQCDCDNCCIPQNPCCIGLKSYVMDLMIVRETLEGYEPGELAHIQNVMAGETIERTHEAVKETEDYTETESTTRKEEENEFSKTERFEMQDAVQKTVSQDLSADAGITASGTYGPAGSYTATANVAYSQSKSEAKQSARNYAKEITQRSILKIQEENRNLSTQRILRRVTETNFHKFEGADQHIIGQYHWVNKRSISQVMNWGKRMMYEFVIPEPSKQYVHLLKKKLQQSRENPLIPLRPDVEPKDITESNYKEYVDKYNLKNVEPISETKETTVSASIQLDPDPEKVEEALSKPVSVAIPTGYVAIGFSVSGGIDWGSSGSYCTIAVGAGETSITYQTYSFPSGTLPNQEGTIPIAAVVFKVDNLNVNVSIKCKRKPDIFDSWQLSIFSKIMDDYNRKLQEYENIIDAINNDTLGVIKGKNPFLNREIERTELWKTVVSLLSCQHYDRFGAMKHKIKPCGYPQLDLQQAKDEGAFIQFFEQVFEVQQMMYLFYPYFWGNKCEWSEQLERDSGDALFDKFLSAGAARCSIPVRPGMEALALHYEQYGEIWMGQGTPDYDPNSPHFLAMHEEIKSRSGNFQQDRPGLLDIDFEYNDASGTQIQNAQGNSLGEDKTIVAVHGTDFWWDWDDQTGNAGAIDDFKIEEDIDREIIIARKSYRIVDIQIDEGSYNSQINIPTNPAQQNDEEFIKAMRWIITLEREVEDPYCTNKPTPMTNIKYAVGAIYVGAEWDNVVPTNLVWLRPQGDDGYSKCLPCYPVVC